MLQRGWSNRIVLDIRRINEVEDIKFQTMPRSRIEPTAGVAIMNEKQWPAAAAAAAAIGHNDRRALAVGDGWMRRQCGQAMIHSLDSCARYATAACSATRGCLQPSSHRCQHAVQRRHCTIVFVNATPLQSNDVAGIECTAKSGTTVCNAVPSKFWGYMPPPLVQSHA